MECPRHPQYWSKHPGALCCMHTSRRDTRSLGIYPSHFLVSETSPYIPFILVFVAVIPPPTGMTTGCRLSTSSRLSAPLAEPLITYLYALSLSDDMLVIHSSLKLGMSSLSRTIEQSWFPFCYSLNFVATDPRAECSQAVTHLQDTSCGTRCRTRALSSASCQLLGTNVAHKRSQRSRHASKYVRDLINQC